MKLENHLLPLQFEISPVRYLTEDNTPVPYHDPDGTHFEAWRDPITPETFITCWSLYYLTHEGVTHIADYETKQHAEGARADICEELANSSCGASGNFTIPMEGRLLYVKNADTLAERAVARHQEETFALEQSERRQLEAAAKKLADKLTVLFGINPSAIQWTLPRKRQPIAKIENLHFTLRDQGDNEILFIPQCRHCATLIHEHRIPVSNLADLGKHLSARLQLECTKCAP